MEWKLRAQLFRLQFWKQARKYPAQSNRYLFRDLCLVWSKSLASWYIRLYSDLIIFKLALFFAEVFVAYLNIIQHFAQQKAFCISQKAFCQFPYRGNSTFSASMCKTPIHSARQYVPIGRQEMKFLKPQKICSHHRHNFPVFFIYLSQSLHYHLTEVRINKLV